MPAAVAVETSTTVVFSVLGALLALVGIRIWAKDVAKETGRRPTWSLRSSRDSMQTRTSTGTCSLRAG